MCYYITGTLSPESDVGAVRRIAKQHLLRWEPIENSFVLSQLGAGYGYYLTTRGMCDCSTELGSHFRLDQQATPADPERKTKKLRKQGWSEVKIARWIADQNAVSDRKRLRREELKQVDGPEVKRWIEFVGEVLRRRHTRSIGVLLHFYSGTVEGERIRFVERQLLKQAALKSAVLNQLRDDVLLEVSLTGR